MPSQSTTAAATSRPWRRDASRARRGAARWRAAGRWRAGRAGSTRGDHRPDHAEDREVAHAGVDRGAEQVDLGQEAAGGREAGQREQAERQARRRAAGDRARARAGRRSRPARRARAPAPRRRRSRRGSSPRRRPGSRASRAPRAACARPRRSGGSPPGRRSSTQMRLTLVWRSAAMLPISIEAMATAATAPARRRSAGAKAVTRRAAAWPARSSWSRSP